MKPTKNRMFCYNCQRVKMLFATQDKADNFIKFNAKEIAEQNHVVPVRSYFCPTCGGWHVTHKEITEKYARTDEQNDKAFRLGVFVSSLKKNFDKKEWKMWGQSLKEYRSWIQELDQLPEHRLFLLETKRQFDHYENLVAAGEREEQKLRNRQLNEINAERKILCSSIRDNLKELNLKECTESARQLAQLMQFPAFDMSEKTIIKECKDMISCILEKEKKSRLENIINTIQYLKGRISYVPTNELRDLVQSLTEDYDFVSCGLHTQKHLLPLQNKIAKYKKHLQGRTSDDSGGDEVDKALLMLETHYDTIRQHLIDTINALQDNDNKSAMESLTMADNRLKAVPMSKRKIEMMQYLTAVAEKIQFE